MRVEGGPLSRRAVRRGRGSGAHPVSAMIVDCDFAQIADKFAIALSCVSAMIPDCDFAQIADKFTIGYIFVSV